MRHKATQIPTAHSRFPAADFNTGRVARRNHAVGPRDPQVVPRLDRQAAVAEILANPGAARAVGADMARGMGKNTPPAVAERLGSAPYSESAAGRGSYAGGVVRGGVVRGGTVKQSLRAPEPEPEADASMEQLAATLGHRFFADKEFMGGFAVAAIECIIELVVAGATTAGEVIHAAIEAIVELTGRLRECESADEAEDISSAIADYSTAVIMTNRIWTESKMDQLQLV